MRSPHLVPVVDKNIEGCQDNCWRLFWSLLLMEDFPLNSGSYGNQNPKRPNPKPYKPRSSKPRSPLLNSIREGPGEGFRVQGLGFVVGCT